MSHKICINLLSVIKQDGRHVRVTGLHEAEAPRDSRQPAHEENKVVSPIYLPPLPPGDTLGTQFC